MHISFSPFCTFQPFQRHLFQVGTRGVISHITPSHLTLIYYTMSGFADSVECIEVLSNDGFDPPRQLTFRGCFKGEEEEICVKILNLPNHTEPLDEMLSDLNGDFAVQVHRVESLGSTRWVIMDYCDCSIGDAIAVLKELSEEQICAIVYGVLKALSALHECEVAHANIKPNNMLIQEGLLILSDQQLSQLSQFKSRPHPGRLYPEEHEAPPVDIWALGISIVEMADRIPPMSLLSEEEVENELLAGHVPVVQSKRFEGSAAMDDFVAKCLELDPNQRATAEELLRHPWVATQTMEGTENIFDALVDTVKGTLSEWNSANGKLIPRVQIHKLFEDQVEEALTTAGAVIDMPPMRLPDCPEEGFTKLPSSLVPEDDPEPIVLKDKTAGEFPLAVPDPEARPQNYIIQNCSKVKVLLLGANLNVLVQRVSNSSIFIGPCKGIVKLEGVENTQIAIAARRVDMERCNNVQVISLYTQEPLQMVSCELDTISLIPWHMAYPLQKEMMKLAGLDPYTNRWMEVETDHSVDEAGLNLLPDPYRLFHISAFPLPGMAGEPTQSIYLLKDVEAPVRPDDHDCIYISSLKQARVVKRPGEISGKSVTIEDSSRSEFLFLDSMSKVELCNLNACQVVCGPTDSLLLKGLVGCVVIAVCDEIQLHQCSDVCLFLWSATPPIVASCAGLEIAYFNVSWPLLDQMVQERGWDKMPNMFEEMRDASPRSSCDAKIHNEPNYRNIPILNEGRTDFIAPINYPFDAKLQVDATLADFEPIFLPTPRRTLDLKVKSVTNDKFLDLATKLPVEYPARFSTPAGLSIRHLAQARIVHMDGTLPDDVAVEMVDSCEILLLDETNTVLVRGAKNSTIVAGPVAGQLRVEDCTNCTIVGCASQIIVTGTTDCRLCVWCSHDFIVHSSSIEVSPWNVVYPHLQEQAESTFGSERLLMESRHNKIYDLSKDDIRYPEPHTRVYPMRDVRLEVLDVAGEADPSPFPFVPVPDVPAAAAPASPAPTPASPEPFSPSSPSPAKVCSPNTISYLDDERVERGLGELSGGAFEMDHATKCVVIIADVAESVTLADCSDCSFVIGASKGAVRVANLVNCKVWCVCPTFAAVALEKCQLHLLCGAAPSFTSCVDTTLSPYNARLPRLPHLLEQAGIDPAVCRIADAQQDADSSVSQPEYVGLLEMQSFVLLKAVSDEPQSHPLIESRLKGVQEAEETAVPVPAKPTGEAVFQRARREALAGVNARGPWDVAGEALVPKAKWDKSEVTATSASYFRGKTVVIGESELKRDQQV